MPSGMIEIMRALAMNGPSTKWDLSSKYSGKTKDGLTPYSYPLILRYINSLLDKGYVKEQGIRKKPVKAVGRPKEGKFKRVKHEAILYDLSWVGFAYILGR